MESRGKLKNFMDEMSSVMKKYRLDLVIISGENEICFGIEDIDTNEVFKVKAKVKHNAC